MPGTVRVHRTCATEFEMVGWLDRLQRKSRVAGFLIAVVYKYFDDQGSYLAALITYYAFDLFGVARSTVYRAQQRHQAAARPCTDTSTVIFMTGASRLLS